MKLIQEQSKFGSRSFALFSLFHKSSPLFQILATRLIRSAKNVIFSLLCILVDRPMGRFEPLTPPCVRPWFPHLESFFTSRLTTGGGLPSHAGLPSNEKADLLAKAGASLPTNAIPCPPPVVAKVRYSKYHNWRHHISHSHLNFQVPEVSSEELLLSRPICCELSRLGCHGHSLLLSSYLHRISRKENSACSACGHPLQDLNHFLLDCPASEPLRKSIFGFSRSILDLWSRS